MYISCKSYVSDALQTTSIYVYSISIIAEKGLDYYTPEIYEELREKIPSCLLTPFKNRVIPRNKRIPIFFGATGGMRLLK